MEEKLFEEGDEYMKSGLNYKLMINFKESMGEVAVKTLDFPKKRDVVIVGKHRAPEYVGSQPHIWKTMLEGIGNKSWIAQWMYQFSGMGKSFFDVIAKDNALMGVNDILASGALPVAFHNEVAAKTSEWFSDKKRSQDYATGVYEICQLCDMALIGGESPAYRFLLNAEPPVGDTPSFSCAVFGIIVPKFRMIPAEIQAGNIIVGAASSGWHSNGATYIIEQGMGLPDAFMTKLPDKLTLGEHTLIPTRSYVALMEAWQNAGVFINAFQPITGDGVAKIAFDKKPLTYRITNWPEEIPLIFQFMMEKFGLSKKGCLRAFNTGIGCVGFFTPKQAERAIEVGEKAGYEMYELGRVEEGERQTIFEPWGGIKLEPVTV